MKYIQDSKGNYLNTSKFTKIYYQTSGRRTEIIAETGNEYHVLYFSKDEDECIGRFHAIVKVLNEE